MQVHQAAEMRVAPLTPSLFHTHTGAAGRGPGPIFGCERSAISVTSGWPCATADKRGTPASIISTFTHVKNQTVSFHFFSWYSRVQSVGTSSPRGSDGLHAGFCLLSQIYSRVCVTTHEDSLCYDRTTSCCLPKLYVVPSEDPNVSEETKYVRLNFEGMCIHLMHKTSRRFRL